MCCNGGCCWCGGTESCGWTLWVESPPGQRIGYVKQQSHGIRFHYLVLDENRTPLLRVRGPVCICECPCNDVDFQVFPLEGEAPIGTVAKQWSGLAKECFTKADNFCVSWPMDLDVKAKALLLGAAFLVDMQVFQQNNN